jgi:tRNA (cmo5U34)-methyltransferase
MNSQHDNLFAETQTSINEFVFDEKVTRVFADMIKRSVPGYTTLLTGIAAIAHQYAQAGTNCYDLGCSLGAASLAMSSAIPHSDCRIIAVDNSAAMIARCRDYMQQAELKLASEVICADILDVFIENASVAVMNLTLQFIPLENRQPCINAIYKGLQPGGVLVLSEKIDFENSRESQLQQSVHHAFKHLHGYTALEISQKRTALENVLIPETLKTHHQRLASAGFSFSTTWFQCFNFISVIAVK